MKALIAILSMVLVMPVAMAKLGQSTKEELKTLYREINSADDPHNDDHIASEITRLVKKSCMQGAKSAMDRRNLAPSKRTQMTRLLNSTCGCVAGSDDVRKGVIDSALLLKRHGAKSTKAKHAMMSAMKKAQGECMQQMLKQMKRSM